MSESSNPFPAPFQALLTRITAAVDNLDLGHATALAGEAVAWGREHGNQEATDRADCNRLGFLVAQNADRGVAGQLQMILMRSGRAGTRYLAAHNLSLLFDHRKQYEKSLFYARLALDAAQDASDAVRLAHCWNRIGNVQIVQCFFREASDAYEKTAALLGEQPSTQHAIVANNLGYCLLMLGEHSAGLAELIKCRRLVRRLKVPGLEAKIGLRLSFCYAYIELGKFGLARRHGQEALKQGEHFQEDDLLEKALYLLGEVEKKAGNEDIAYGHFERLEKTFHPDKTDLTQLLMAVESHRLVNLHA